MPSKTPNLDLLKKDPATDGNDTFNIKEMLNDNFDKIDTAVGNKVDKVSGKGLSANDYTTAEKTKLSGITAGAGGAGSASDSVIGSRTATESVTPSLTGTITALFSSLFTLIKGITGKASSLTAPAINLEQTKAHVDDTTRHITAAERTDWNAKETTGGAQTKANSAQAAAIAAAATDASTKANAVQTNLTTHVNDNVRHITAAERAGWNALATTITSYIPVAQRNVANGVAALDSDSYVVGKGVVLEGAYAERAFAFSFAHGTANQKIDYTLPAQAFGGFVEITIAGSWNNAETQGRLTKRLDVMLSAATTIHRQTSEYTEVSGAMRNNVSISDIYWKDGLWTLTIESRNTQGNAYAVKIQTLGPIGSKRWTQGAPYTGAATTLPLAVQTIPDDTVTQSGYEIQKHALTGNTGLGKGGNPTVSPNTLLETGMYTLTFTSPDLPVTGSTTTVIVKRYNSSYITQDADVYATVNTATTIRKFTRESRNSGSSWSAWREIKVKAAAMAMNTDLNTLLAEGEFYTISNAQAGTMTNQPITGSYCFNLTVKTTVSTDGAGCNQTIIYYSTSASSPAIYTRNYYSSTWTAWQQIETTAQKNVSGGYAGLDSNGDIALSAVPDAVQKFSLTQDNGKNLILESGYNLNSLVTAGFYDGVNLVNAPNSTNWWHIQVQVHSGTNNGNDYISQIAINLNASGTPHHFMRRRVNSAWGIWVGIPNSSMYNVASGIAGLTSAGVLPDAILPQSVTRRVNLTGSLQTTSYRRSVIALCELTNTNPSASSFSNGLLLMRRHNGLNGQITAMIAAEKRFNTTAMNWSLFKIGASSQVFRPCTFTYNGVKYGGIDVYITDAEYQTISFNGDTNFSIFGLDWYNIQSSTVLNAEISGSISYVEGSDYFYSPDIHFNGENLNTKYSTLAGKTLAEVVQGSLSYAVTTGTYAALAASLNPAPAALTVGLRLTIKAHVASPGPATLNVNGLGAKSIKKPNGNNAALALGGVYTLVYDGSVFQLQGEGGEYGTAEAAQVLSGYTVGRENGVVNGTMPDHRGVAKDAAGTILNDSGDLFLNPPAGYYDPTASIHSYEGNLANRRNWRSDITLFGKAGTMPVITSGSDPAQGVGIWPDGGLAVYPSEGYRKGVRVPEK